MMEDTPSVDPERGRILSYLKALQELFSDRGRWTRGTSARDSLGSPVDPLGVNACCWCIVGGIRKVVRSSSPFLDGLSVGDELLKSHKYGRDASRRWVAGLSTLNDDKGYDFVVRLVHDAVERVEGTITKSQDASGENDMDDELRQVIVVDRSLKLSPGKLAVQVAHAAVGAAMETDQDTLDHWLWQMTKVVLLVNSTAELLDLQDQAQAAGLPCHLVEDAGRTEIAPGTVTCIGIGPARKSDLDKITGRLSLY